MAAPRHQKTIAFFDILNADDGQQVPFAEVLTWDAALNHVSNEPLTHRTIQGTSGRELIGSPIFGIEHTHLLLHKARGDGDWMSRANLTTGTVDELIAAQDERYVDSTVVCWVPDANRVAMLRGGSAAPTHNDLMHWFNAMKMFTDTTFVVSPVLRMAEVQRLHASDAAQRIDLRFTSESQVQHTDGFIADRVSQLLQRYPGASVTLTVSMGRKKYRAGDADPRATLREDMVGLLPALTPGDSAAVGLLFQEGPNYSKQQLVDLVEHDLTLKVNLIESDGDQPLRLRAAVEHVENLLLDRPDEP